MNIKWFQRLQWLFFLSLARWCAKSLSLTITAIIISLRVQRFYSSAQPAMTSHFLFIYVKCTSSPYKFSNSFIFSILSSGGKKVKNKTNIKMIFISSYNFLANFIHCWLIFFFHLHYFHQNWSYRFWN